MKAAQSSLLIMLLVGVAGLALWTTHRHYAARDANSAVVSLMTHRFDGTTRSRLKTWLNARGKPGDDLRTSTEAYLPGPFASHVDVDLRVNGVSYRFSVGIRDRLPIPQDAATQAFVQQMRDELAADEARK